MKSTKSQYQIARGKPADISEISQKTQTIQKLINKLKSEPQK